MMIANKLSVITVCFNSEETIISCLNSIANQKFVKFEHIIIDGNSTDKTSELIKQYTKNKNINVRFISEPDQGIYDALNKGIQMASGEIVGILHADDQYFDSNVLKDIMNCYDLHNWDVLYGDLVYEKITKRQVLSRVWKSDTFKIKNLKLGWMPPHPTLFIKLNVIKKIGGYDPSYKISGDYDFIWRLFKQASIKSFYFRRYITRMQLGGISNGSIKNLLIKYKEDYRIAKLNTRSPFLCLFFKNIRKIPQIFRKI